MEVRVQRKNGDEKQMVKGQQPKKIDYGKMLVNI
jgi:hypothetical protein